MAQKLLTDGAVQTLFHVACHIHLELKPSDTSLYKLKSYFLPGIYTENNNSETDTDFNGQFP